MDSLAAEQDIRPGTIVECKRDELVSGCRRSRIRNCMDTPRRSFPGYQAAGNSLAVGNLVGVGIGPDCYLAGPRTCAERAENGN